MTRRRTQPSLAALVAALHAAPHPWTRAMLEDRWSGKTLSEACRLGFVVRIAPGQYAHRDHAGDVACRLEAVATWMAPHGAVSGLAALWLRGWRGTEPTRIDVVLPRDIRLARPPYVDTFRTDDAASVSLVREIPVVTAPDAAILAWRRAAPPARRGLMLDLLRDGAVAAQELEGRMAGVSRIPDRHGLRHTIGLARHGVQSMLEHIAATEVFHGAEWRDWVRQGEVMAGGIALHPDLVNRAARIAIEFDGKRFHSSDGQRRRDLERDVLLASAGYVVIRFTWEDVTRRPDWCRARVREALAARAA